MRERTRWEEGGGVVGVGMRRLEGSRCGEQGDYGGGGGDAVGCVDEGFGVLFVGVGGGEVEHNHDRTV